jgi:hypothetical protein
MINAAATVTVSAAPGRTLPYTVSCRACGRWSDCTAATAALARCPSCGAWCCRRARIAAKEAELDALEARR